MAIVIGPNITYYLNGQLAGNNGAGQTSHHGQSSLHHPARIHIKETAQGKKFGKSVTTSHLPDYMFIIPHASQKIVIY